MAVLKTFYDVPAQDVERAPLAEGEETSIGVFGLLNVATGTNGSQLWRKFKKNIVKATADRTFTMPRGVTILDEPMEGKRSTAVAVVLSDAPMLLAVVLEKEAALRALRNPELKLEESLVVRGLAEADARAAIERAARVADPVLPGDVELVQQVTQLFGAQSTSVRFARVPRHESGGSGNAGAVLVFSVVDLVMVAKRCNYAAAWDICRKLLHEYYDVDGEQTEVVNFSRFPGKFHRLHLPGSSRGGESLALDAQGASELLCLIPGSDVSAALRRRAVDTMLRVEGGDESLVDHIKANRHFQQYLAANDPSHPLRAVGEHAERRQAEEETAGELAARRRKANLELEMLECEARTKRYKEEHAWICRADAAQRSSREEEIRRLSIIKDSIQNREVFGLDNLDVTVARDIAKSIILNTGRPVIEATGDQLDCEDFLIKKGLSPD